MTEKFEGTDSVKSTVCLQILHLYISIYVSCVNKLLPMKTYCNMAIYKMQMHTNT